MNTTEERGFTKVELLVVVVVLFFFTGVAVPGFLNDRDSVKEAEVRQNIHIIQMAIERYEVDNGYYPSFLLGGDQKGWNEWHSRNDETEPAKHSPSNNIVNDVLIQYGYLESYPKNPFVNNGIDIIKSTCDPGSKSRFSRKYGDGDPRFGFRGNRMGNGLSDPAFYKHRLTGIPQIETPLVETSRTLGQDTIKRLGFHEPPDGLHYMMGGRKAFDSDGNVITVSTWWPGNFFYRGLCSKLINYNSSSNWFDPGVVPDGTKMDRYILGGYGSSTTTGMDIIRLEGANYDNTDDVFYRLSSYRNQYTRENGIKCGWGIDGTDPSGQGSGLPEVSGGGDMFTGPVYPYNRGSEVDGYGAGKFIYGAPDGHPDGVIQVVFGGTAEKKGQIDISTKRIYDLPNQKVVH